MPTEAITKRGVLIADHSPNMAALVAVMLRSIGRKDIREVYDAEPRHARTPAPHLRCHHRR